MPTSPEAVLLGKMAYHPIHFCPECTFSDSCAQNRHDLLAKIVEHKYRWNLMWRALLLQALGFSQV